MLKFDTSTKLLSLLHGTNSIGMNDFFVHKRYFSLRQNFLCNISYFHHRYTFHGWCVLNTILHSCTYKCRLGYDGLKSPSDTEGSDTRPVNNSWRVISSWIKKMKGLFATTSWSISESSPNLLTSDISAIKNIVLLTRTLQIERSKNNEKGSWVNGCLYARGAIN